MILSAEDFDNVTEASERVSRKELGFAFKAAIQDEQIVTGEVYAPYIIDSHKEMMLPEGVRELAHSFLIMKKNGYIDLQHNNKWVQASVVESYIAKANDPEFEKGAWVLSVKIFDTDLWADIKTGKFNGFSFEALVYRYEADVVYDYLPIHLGLVEDNDGHDHSFYVEVDKDGRVIGGLTGPGGSDGHTHKITAGTATEMSNDHAHRFFLNEIPDEDQG